ncbi:MAG: M3 family oligoendopeptidase [Defluviitaleaceae bacterium]|nr:M3 family oligoendopeptidase [Defluviitaleaceae bacterium]
MYNTWNLDVLYTDFESEKFKKDYANLPKEIEKIVKYAKENFDTTENVKNPKETLENFVKMSIELSRFDNISWYTGLILETDAENSQALKIDNTTDEIFTEITPAYTMFKAYLLKLPDLKEIINSSQILKEHGFYLLEAKEEAKHMLSTEEEMVLAKLELTGSNAWETFYTEITSTLEVPIDINGKRDTLTLSQVRNMSEEKDPYIRKTAYFAELAAYTKIEKPVATCLNSIKGEAITVAKMRGYDSVLDMTLKTSRMDSQTLGVLISTMKDALPTFRKYYKHKAKLLGHDGGLPFWDLSAPIGNVNMTFSKKEAVDYVVENFNNFSEDLGSFTKNAFEKDWVDWDPRKGKTGGAFCAGLHNVKESRILMNFSGSFGDVLTLAHEFGHAYHDDALKDETSLNSDYSMPIAEVASTFCEDLVCNAALKNATKDEARVIMENNLQSMGAVIVDIYSRYLFETEVFKRREQGSLSVSELKEIMVESQKSAYGEGLSTYHPYMWLCKSHYYSVNYNFYNFPYAYGMLFAKGLYSMYLQEGASFAKKYKDLLSVTGKNNLWDVGQIIGVDIRKKDFWQGALKEVEKEVDAFLSI